MWEKQWQLFAPNFKEGKAHIDLTPYGCPETLQLYAGPGFGDFSHPTTRLVMRLMHPYIQNRPVIDIGCGSGILSLAAAAMGATQVYGYDIDPEAVQHAQRNLELSPFFQKVLFSLSPPRKIAPKTVFLMNMISLEQEQAWAMIADHVRSPALLITSGVLVENEKQYLEWKARHGCKLKQTLKEEDWSGFAFAL